mmetsp:Transcript_12072/g.25470  ORF Transcript_12072/g.25470 Transcript_12072/m.25470 type:complete len:88 (-) Transcript_12072:61-324(-)
MLRWYTQFGLTDSNQRLALGPLLPAATECSSYSNCTQSQLQRDYARRGEARRGARVTARGTAWGVIRGSSGASAKCLTETDDGVTTE